MTELRHSGRPRIKAYKASHIWRGPGRLEENLWVVARENRIEEVTSAPPARASCLDLGRGLLMPGLVNAHTHVELSFLAGKVPPAGDFVGWLEGLVALRPDHDKGAAKRAAVNAATDMAQCGTALVGDITNTGRARSLLLGAGLSVVSFYEALGPVRAEPPDESLEWIDGLLDACAIAAHAPYSIPVTRMEALAKRSEQLPFCLHLAESKAEMEFFSGEGLEGQKLEHFLEARGLLKKDLGDLGSTPIKHLLELGALGPGTMAVHGVQLAGDDLELFAGSGASLCVCPRSNLGLTGKIAPVARLAALGVNLALGTDSLASAPDLGIGAEMAELCRLEPGLSPETVLSMATLGGASALGLVGHFGSIDPGKCARMAFACLDGITPAEALEAVATGSITSREAGAERA